MSNFLRFLKSFLQKNDPAAPRAVDTVRYDLLRSRILLQASITAQDVKAMPVRRSFVPFMPLGRGAELAFCSLLLMLGLWVGQNMRMETDIRQISQAQNEETYSVVAMATPWEGWIEGGQ